MTVMPPRDAGTDARSQCRAVFAVFAAFVALVWATPPHLSAAGPDKEIKEIRRVEENRGGPSRWRRLRDFLANLVDPYAEKPKKVGAGVVRGRNDDDPDPCIRPPSLFDMAVFDMADKVCIPADPYRDGTAKTNRLVAGKRALHVRWRGGTAPYRLNLLRVENGVKRPVIPEHVVPSRRADLLPADLRPGTYILVIKDARAYGQNPDPGFGPAVVMDLQTLPPEARPAMPTELAAAPCSRELKDLLYAAWLAKQGDGEWALEALQSAAPLAAGSREAAAWLNRWGGE